MWSRFDQQNLTDFTKLRSRSELEQSSKKIKSIWKGNVFFHQIRWDFSKYMVLKIDQSETRPIRITSTTNLGTREMINKSIVFFSLACIRNIYKCINLTLLSFKYEFEEEICHWNISSLSSKNLRSGKTWADYWWNIWFETSKQNYQMDRNVGRIVRRF